MNATAPGVLIDIDELTRIYPAAVPIRALDGVTLAVPEGVFLGISGSSGSGKSTLLNILGGPSGSDFLKYRTFRSKLNYCDICDYHIHAVGGSERDAALLYYLGFIIFSGMFGSPDDFLSTESEVHTTADVTDTPAGEHPVGQIAFIAYFQYTQYRDINPTAADHGERIGMIEKGHTRFRVNVLSAGIGQINIGKLGHIVLGNNPAESEGPVFGMISNLNTLGNKTGAESGDTDAKVDDGTIKKFFGYSHSNSFTA